MPKHIIEFQIPEENEELNTVMNAGNVQSKLWDWENSMRSIIKYGAIPPEFNELLEKGKLTADDIVDVVDIVRGLYFDIMNEE